MVLPISPIQGVTPPVSPIQTNATADTSATGGSDFSSSLASAVDDVQQLQSTSDGLAVQAVTGNLNDIHQATIASTRAQVTLELVSAVRDKGVDAFNQIMNMQA